MLLIQASLSILFVAIVSELILLLLDENAENQSTEHTTSKQYTENLYKRLQRTSLHKLYISVYAYSYSKEGENICQLVWQSAQF